MTDNMIHGTPGDHDDEHSASFHDFLRQLLEAKEREEDEEEDEDDARPFSMRAHDDDDDYDDDDDDVIHFAKDDDDDDDDELNDMDADDVHNKAVDLARRSQFTEAVRMCMKGLERFPDEIDLLADTIKYSCKAGDLANAAAHYEKMCQIPRPRWNWRAYSFAFDYLVLKPIENEAACRELIADYKRYVPHEEKSWVSESELEEQLGNHERSMSVLTEILEKNANAPQSALRLVDMQKDRGMNRELITTCFYGLSASCEAQPSINIPYLLLQRTMAKEALLFQRLGRGEHVTAEELDVLIEEYQFLEDKFMELAHYGRAIRTHRQVLQFEKISRSHA